MKETTKRKVLKLSRYMSINVSCLLVVLSILSGFILVHHKTVITRAKSDTADVYGANACTFTAANITTHSVSINPGNSSSNIAQTRLKTICSDAPSFEVFAIGYSNNSSGNTKLIGQNGGGNISTAVSGSSSRWSMKVAKDTSSYLPANMTIENSFGSNHVVPNATTLIATYGTYTDTTTGASIITSYNVSIAAGQAADSYIGKVKYSIVAAEPPPLCPAGYICYDGNNDNVVGTMNPKTYSGDLTSKKGYQAVTSGSSVILQAPNYRLTGYGFAGWNTKEDGTGTFYGPNQAITVPNVSSEGLMLYATWIASTGSFHNWQGCSSLTKVTFNSSTGAINAPLSSMTALTDTRDNQTYVVARLPDDNCWMIENLRFGGNSTTLSEANTHNPAIPLYYYSGSTQYTTSSYTSSTATSSWCYDDTQSCTERLLFNTDNVTQGISASTYSTTGPVIAYGSYYNWYGATAGRASHYYTGEATTDGDICPRGWSLPYNHADEWDSIGNLSKQYGGGYGHISDQTIINRLTSFPNNFVYGGYAYQGTLLRGSATFYSSNTATNIGYGAMYGFLINAQNGVNSRFIETGSTMSSQTGMAVRCLRTAAKEIEDLTYMQDFATLSDVDYAGVWNSMIEWWQYQLKDSRDNKTYWITKLGDGNIWMSQNLDLDIARKYYYHADTDIGYEDSSTSWYPQYATSNVYNYSGNYITAWNFNNSNYPVSLNPGTSASTNWYWDAGQWSSGNYDGYNYLKGQTGGMFNTSPYATNGTHGHVGNYYNWAAAVATNNASQYGHLQNAPNSICPAGWRLPKYNASLSPSGSSDYTELDQAVQSIWDEYYGSGNQPDGANNDVDMYLTGAPFYFPRAGQISKYTDPSTYTTYDYGVLESAGTLGSAYWSATSYIISGYMDTAAYDWYWWGNYAQGGPEFSYGRGTGMSVRCLARPQWEIDRTGF